MAAGAGSLGVACGGVAVYHGREEVRPQLGWGSAPQAEDVRRACRLVMATLWVWLAVLCVLAGLGEVWRA